MDEATFKAFRLAIQEKRCPRCNAELHEPSDTCSGITEDELNEVYILQKNRTEKALETGKKMLAALQERGITDIKTLAAEIGVSEHELYAVRYVSKQWPKGKRANASWEVHSILAPHPERFTLIRDGMTVAEAQAIMRKYAQS
jgi:hypothetical protein